MRRGLALLAVAVLTITPALAEPGDAVAGAYTLLEPVNLYDGTPPGSEGWPGNLGIAEESAMEGPAGGIYNVSIPTLTPYLPTEERNTGTAVIIAPGGGFRLLAMRHEGRLVAEWLAERGVAAFILKYRTVQLQKLSDFAASGQAVPRDVAAGPARADGLKAIAMVREHAEEYRIDPAKVVFVGFSAGADVAAMAALSPDLAARPNYVAPIYGAPLGESAPALPAADAPDALPPVFLAVAQNDAGIAPVVRAWTSDLVAAGYQPEVHFYATGNHGFGMTRQGTTSDRWIEDFYWWMTTQGLTQKPGEPAHEFTPMPGPNLRED